MWKQSPDFSISPASRKPDRIVTRRQTAYSREYHVGIHMHIRNNAQQEGNRFQLARAGAAGRQVNEVVSPSSVDLRCSSSSR